MPPTYISAAESGVGDYRFVMPLSPAKLSATGGFLALSVCFVGKCEQCNEIFIYLFSCLSFEKFRLSSEEIKSL